MNNSLFLNNNNVELTKVSNKSFSRWLLQQNRSFKNSTQAIKEYLHTKDFIVGINKISLTTYKSMQNSFKQLTTKV